MLSSYVQDALLDLNQVLAQQGAQAALALLNARAPHRFTAANKFEDGHMVCLLLHDKAGKLQPGMVAKVPLGHSFCQFVMRDGSFNTTHSGEDERLLGHPSQGVMLSYCGVPLLNAAGEVAGTLCHMDAQSQQLSDAEFDVFQRAARVLPKYLRLG
ncbi:hypothetical protein ACFIQF_04175 [Comamonas sp. J-3]|jgi:GAF domain-containing protein|uniref:hypothetical protein n=1 Tax=Comamonas trifloxystrobinivorans TaxID=3350256 RepID=UPI003729F939